MRNARNYWVATHAAAFPSARPVWGIWRNAELWFSTGSAIGANLRRNPRLQVNLESADEVVIIEGMAKPLLETESAAWASVYNEKYLWDMPADAAGVWKVAPQRVLAWICDSSGLDRGAGFSNSATEWRFGASA